MAEILRISNTYTQIDYQPASNDILLLRKMVSFIHENYKNTDLPITIIAMDCGFNHASYYSKLFLQYYHCTPSKYRDNI